MTTTGKHVAAPPDNQGIRRRIIYVTAAVALVVLGGGLATLGTLRHLDHQYGPLQGGSFSGPYSDRGFVFTKYGSSYHLAEAPGATARMIASLDNLGAHSVKITSIETDDIVSDIRWSVYRVVADGNIDGLATPWRAFPAIVPAHGTIRLLITIRHPNNCSSYPEYGGVREAMYGGAHVVHCESLLHSHTTLVDVLLAPDEGVRVC
jgi:hypothetical protein